MAVFEQQLTPDRDDDSPDRSFAAALGLYLGVVVAGLSAIGGLLAGASTPIVLATTPGTVTAILILTLLVGDRFAPSAARIGRHRSRQSLWAGGPIAFLVVGVVAATTPIGSGDQLLFISIVGALVSGAIATGLAQQCRNRYVDAVTPDEPTITWTWQKTGFGSGKWIVLATMGGLVLIGLGMVTLGNWFGLFWVIYGVVMAAMTWPTNDSNWFTFEGKRRNLPTLHVHEAGLVVDKPFENTIVPWEAIRDVQLTENELRLERRWVDIRCDRSVIEDADAVCEAIKAARERSHDRVGVRQN